MSPGHDLELLQLVAVDFYQTATGYFFYLAFLSIELCINYR